MFNDDDNPKGVFVENSGRRYRLMTLDDFRRFRVLTEDDVGWDEQAIADKYRVHTKDPTPLPGEETSNLKLIRVRAEYPSVPAQILFDAISDSDYRKSWDKDMMEDYPLCGLDEHNEIGYYAAAFPWPLWNRDFCNMRSWMEFTNGEYIIFNHSVPHEKLPPRKEFTRAMSYVTGYYMVPRPDGGCTLNFISHCDPKGAIPHALVNFFMKRGRSRYHQEARSVRREVRGMVRQHISTGSRSQLEVCPCGLGYCFVNHGSNPPDDSACTARAVYAPAAESLRYGCRSRCRHSVKPDPCYGMRNSLLSF